MDTIFSQELIKSGFTFEEYMTFVGKLVEKNATTGPDQSLEKIEMTRLNQQRLKRISRTCVISPDLKNRAESIEEPLTWIMLIEAWCGDGAQVMPYFAATAALNPRIEFRLLLRDENPDLMNRFLTDGKRAIPKFIGLDSRMNLMATWGPRPAPAHQLYLAYKDNPQMTKDEFHKELHLWYARDKGKAIMDEMTEIFRNCCIDSEKAVSF